MNNAVRNVVIKVNGVHLVKHYTMLMWWNGRHG